ncbi:dynein heavy chain, partial [Rozella allomycis CSF55]
FGIHENGEISKQLAETKSLFDSLLLTTENISSQKNSASNLLENVVSDILGKLTTPFNIDLVQRKFPISYNNSMNTVLVQEMIRYNKLISVIHSSLVNVEKALKGLIVMSSELEDICKSILMGKVPVQWASKSYPSLKPLGSYVNDLLKRILFLNAWFENGAPLVYWLPGFFFTQSFITGALQNYARKYTIPIDELSLDFELVYNVTEPPTDGVYVNGLFLEGARWSKTKHCLAESYPKELYDALPTILFKPIKSTELKPKSVYECPVYKTSERKGCRLISRRNIGLMRELLLYYN